MENTEKNNWDKANQQDQNLDTTRNHSNREFHNEDDRHQNQNSEGRERQADDFNDDKNDGEKNTLSESDDSYGHGKEFYSKNYGAGGRSSRDDIPSNDSGA